VAVCWYLDTQGCDIQHPARQTVVTAGVGRLQESVRSLDPDVLGSEWT